MTNQLNISAQNASSNWTKFWFISKIFLVLLFAVLLFSALSGTFSVPTVFYAGLPVLFLLAFFMIKLNRKQTQFIKVENQQLHYFCPVKKEKISIPISEITKVTSQFCELQIHTSNRTYCLNLNNIREEKQRWEIKETIKKLVPNTKQAVNF
ncbi:MAG: hypothetical protein EOP42_24530 [Sphingobacteriaceae bacterium]|nr:MAG: hypothetical protein EOP42_24530 [Sphingobacteriaceae bacterium]